MMCDFRTTAPNGARSLEDQAFSSFRHFVTKVTFGNSDMKQASYLQFRLVSGRVRIEFIIHVSFQCVRLFSIRSRNYMNVISSFTCQAELSIVSIEPVFFFVVSFFERFFELSHAEEATVSEETTVKDVERSGKISRFVLEENVSSSSNSGYEEATSEKDALYPLFTFSWHDFRFFTFDKM